MTSASHDTVGFSRLGALTPATVAITLGSARAVFTPAELEARLALPDLAKRLVDVAVSAVRNRVNDAKGGKGVSKQVSGTPNANADRNSLAALAFQGADTPEGSPDPARATAVDNREGFARYLAASLGDTDPKNLPFYRKMVRTVPRNVLQDALNRAKDAQDVRTSRARLFTHILMREGATDSKKHL